MAIESKGPVVGSRTIPLDAIETSPFQPPGRRAPSPDHIRALADDLLVRGQLTSIIVRPKGDRFELMGGERRFRAFQLNRERVAPDQRSAWESIRGDVRSASDSEAADIVAVENLQREQLTDLDEAFTYVQLMELHRFTQIKELADHLKRPARTIQRLVQIHRAPEFIKEAMTKGLLQSDADGAPKTHRRLEREPALVFIRLHEFFAGQVDSNSQKEIDDAREGVGAAKREVRAAQTDSERSVAEKRLERAHTAADRIEKRVKREAERRADVRVGGAIERALGEGWSLRRVESFYKSITDNSSSAQKTSAVLFKDDGQRLVVNRGQLAGAAVEERARLVVLLRAVIEQIASVSADAR